MLIVILPGCQCAKLSLSGLFRNVPWRTSLKVCTCSLICYNLTGIPQLPVTHTPFGFSPASESVL